MEINRLLRSSIGEVEGSGWEINLPSIGHWDNGVEVEEETNLNTYHSEIGEWGTRLEKITPGRRRKRI